MNDFDLYNNKGKQAVAARNADQAEQAAIERGAITVEEGIRDELTADAMDDFTTSEPAGWPAREIELEEASGQITDEIKRRQAVVGAGYPFELSGSRLTYTGTVTLVYEFCLAVSMVESKQGGLFRTLERAFERLTCRTVEHFLGDARSYRTGWSGDDAEDRPARFKAVCDEVHTLMGTGEFKWGPAPDHPTDPSTRLVKDLGIDALVWKVFGDRRRGNILLLGQCACGGNWREKSSDIKLDDMREYWFRPFTAAPPIRFFSVPIHIPNSADFNHVNTNYGLALDRARLTRIAERGDESRAFVMDGRQDDYTKLISAVFEGFGVAK
jgi:hypothetical protein